jgi:gliding motility-associated lipoprotein GldH
MMYLRDMMTLWVGLLCLCGGCREDASSPLYENFRALPGERWERDNGVTFDVNILRPGRYSLALYLRHTIDIAQANVSCRVTVSHPGVPAVEERAEIFVLDSQGHWMGRGIALKTAAFPTRSYFQLDSTGTYRVEIRHQMKEKRLKGIKDIGIQVHGEK